MKKMSPYTQLPGTDLEPFRICLGTVNIGTLDDEASFALLDAYTAAGGNFIDTAKVYSDWLPNAGSSSEKAIGLWMQARRNRASIILATKGAHPELDSMHIARMSPAEIQFDVEASLRHLQTDVIDLYWLHRDDIERPVEEIIDALNVHVQDGKLRFLGCSNWQAGRIQAANEYAVQSGKQGFVANQPLWNLAQIDTTAITDQTMVVMNDALYSYHLRSGLAAIPYTSQANGLFNKLASGQYGSLGKMQQNMYAGGENQSRFERIMVLSEQTGLSITQIVLGYLLSQPFTTIPIIGSHTLDQLHDSLTAADVLLEEHELQYLMNTS
jgi:aryl-alcohol dehydrogenase-like predicted oxidoreductase